MDESLPSTVGDQPTRADFHRPLFDRFASLQSSRSVHWTAEYRLLRKLGAGSQGVVWLADRLGSLNVSLRVALKLFSPSPYADTDAYLSEMSQTARISMRIAEIQQDHLLDVHNFIECGGVQIMVVEWVDGFDLKYLVELEPFRQAAGVAGRDRWERITDVVAMPGPSQIRLKPGVAIAVLRQCLEGLNALHQRRIVHGDIKPSNIMLKRTGDTKIIDYGSAFSFGRPRRQPAWTPRYAALEVLETGEFERNSDLASLGYVFLELLSGRSSFEDAKTREELIAAKSTLHERFPQLLSRDVQRDHRLLELIRRMIHPDPAQRFESPSVAELSEDGAAAAHRRLVLGDLASEYVNDIQEWLRFMPQPKGAA